MALSNIKYKIIIKNCKYYLVLQEPSNNMKHHQTYTQQLSYNKHCYKITTYKLYEDL